MSDTKNRSSNSGEQRPTRQGSERNQGANPDAEQEGAGPDIQKGSPLDDIIGTVLSGGGQGGATGSSGQGGTTGSSGQGGIDLGGLIGTLLGDGTSAHQAPSAPQQGLPGGLGALVTPLVRPLAQRLGIPESVAQAVVIFVLTKLLAASATQGTLPQTPTQQPSPASTAGASQMDNLLQQITSGQRVNTQDVHNTGLAGELAQQTGIDRDKAAQGIQEVLSMLGSRAKNLPGE